MDDAIKKRLVGLNNMFVK